MYIDISNRKIFITVSSWFLQKKKTRAGKKDLLRKVMGGLCCLYLSKQRPFFQTHL